MISVLKRVWLPLLIVVAVTVGALSVTFLRSVFGSDGAVVTPIGSDTAESFNPKVVTYEVFGSGSTAIINYTDLKGLPQRTGEVSLPWSLKLETTVPSVTPNLLAQGNGQSIQSDLSPDGRYVVFYSVASNLVAGDANGAYDVFLRDTATGHTILISSATDGTQGNGDSVTPAVSDDGRFVVFYSVAANLVAGDSNGSDDIFLRDTLTGATTRLSTATDGTQGNSDSYNADLSGDGRYVAFYSLASNLVAGDTNGTQDVFLRDMLAGTTIRLSVGLGGVQANGVSFDPEISSDGHYVTFASTAGNLAPGVGNGIGQIFRVSLVASDAADWMVGSDGNDVISGLGGSDILTAGLGNDTLVGGAGIDTLDGGLGNDTYVIAAGDTAATGTILDHISDAGGTDLVEASVTVSIASLPAIENVVLTAGAGNSDATGNAGANTLIGNAGANHLSGGDGNDTLIGGAGADALNGGAGIDTASYVTSTGGVNVNLATGIGAAFEASGDTLTGIENLTGGSGSDWLRGDGNANTLIGNAGSDTLQGFAGLDTLIGGDGNDMLTGGAGKDTLAGGAGADKFVYSAIGDSPVGGSSASDVITDFSHAQGDRIDLSAIDANTGVAGDQAFSLIGTAAFGHHAGELRFETVSGVTSILGDVNGDGTADFQIRLSGTITLVAADFVL